MVKTSIKITNLGASVFWYQTHLQCSISSVVSVGQHLNRLLKHDTKCIHRTIRCKVCVVACTHLKINTKYKPCTLLKILSQDICIRSQQVCWNYQHQCLVCTQHFYLVISHLKSAEIRKKKEGKRQTQRTFVLFSCISSCLMEGLFVYVKML